MIKKRLKHPKKIKNTRKGKIISHLIFNVKGNYIPNEHTKESKT